MSHIQKRADRRYRALVDPDGRERSRTFTRKADAERHLAAVEEAKSSGTYVGDANPITVGDLRPPLGRDASAPADHSNASPLP